MYIMQIMMIMQNHTDHTDYIGPPLLQSLVGLLYTEGMPWLYALPGIWQGRLVVCIAHDLMAVHCLDFGGRIKADSRNYHKIGACVGMLLSGKFRMQPRGLLSVALCSDIDAFIVTTACTIYPIYQGTIVCMARSR